MTRYVYIVKNTSRSYNTYNNELYHFNFKFPDIKLPDIKLPDIGKAVNDFGKGASKALNDTGKNIAKGLNDAGKQVSQTVTGTLGGFTGRQWKQHKWVARKRDKNGKWIYDYGNGFPGERTLGSIGTNKDVNVTPDNDIKLYAPSPLRKFLTPLVGLGKALVGTTMEDSIEGGKEFLGGISEALKQMEASALKFGTEKDSTGLNRKRSDQGREFDLKHANPGYDNKDGGSQSNCPCCSVAYDMRRRGYEVTAKQTMKGLPENQIASFYKNPKIHEITSNQGVYVTGRTTVPDYVNQRSQNLSRAVEKQFKTEPDNTRGLAYVEWNAGGGHIFAYEKDHGVTKFYDAQSGEVLDISDYVDQSSEFRYFRTDNLEPNYEQVKKVVE